MNTDCLNDGQTLFSKDGTISLLTSHHWKVDLPLTSNLGGLDSLVAKSAAEVVLYDFKVRPEKAMPLWPCSPGTFILRATPCMSIIINIIILLLSLPGRNGAKRHGEVSCRYSDGQSPSFTPSSPYARYMTEGALDDSVPQPLTCPQPWSRPSWGPDGVNHGKVIFTMP